MPQSMSGEVRALAAKRTGIPAANIAITATHTHTGPLFAGERARVFSEQAAAKFGTDPLAAVKYPEALRNQLVEVIAAASARVSPAAMEFVLARDDRLSFNRRFHLKDGSVRFNSGLLNPEIVRAAGPIDPDAPFLLFTKDKKTVGSLSVFAMHLDTVDGTEYSADYPGYLAGELRHEFGDEFISVFGTGTCGDINHIDVSGQRRYTARLIGQQLAIDVLSVRSRAALDRVALSVTSARLSLPLRSVSAEQAASAKANMVRVGTNDLPFLAQVEAVTTLDLVSRGATLDTEVQVLPQSRRRHRPAPGRGVRRSGTCDQAPVTVQAHAGDRAQQRQSGLHPDGTGVQGRQLRNREFANRTRRRGTARGDRDSTVERHRGKVASP
jgi:hypothetical protein